MSTSDIEQLAQAYLDGAGDAETVARLDEILARDEDARHAFLREAAMDVRLSACLKRSVTTVRAGSAMAVSRSEPQAVRRPLVLVPLAVAAAALLVVLAGGWWLAHRGVRVQPQQAAMHVSTETTQPAQAVVPEVKVSGKLLEVSGDVGVAQSGGGLDYRPLVAGDQVILGQCLMAGKAARAVVELTDTSRLTVYRDSWLTVEASEGWALRLERGGVDVEAAAQGQGRVLQVATAHLTAEVKGTAFRVLTDANSSWVGVRSGQVRVVSTAARKPVILTPGRYAAVAPGWPFQLMDGRCPYWRGQCQAKTGDSEYLSTVTVRASGGGK
jgi:ferric-dicitrate binding protein FerR (iron transport regulator)